MAAKIQVVFYSMYGHVYKMAEAIAAGAREVSGAEVSIHQVPELVPDEVLEQSGAKAARAAFAHIPIIKPEQLAQADAIIFGTPTRFGNMAAQMRNFLDQTGALWMSGGLIGKVGSVFTSTASQHGGQETTITSFHTTLLHQGMIVVGCHIPNSACLAWTRSVAAHPTARALLPAATARVSRAKWNWRSRDSRDGMSPRSPASRPR
jgi:NAD(P)H dehydrogenase (quinone)